MALWLLIPLCILGAVVIAFYMYAMVILAPRNEIELARLIQTGRITPEEARMLKAACKAGLPYMPPYREVD